MDEFSLLKYLGTAFSTVYGVYATMTDFRVDVNGQKRLTRRGILGIGLLCLSAVASLSGDIGKDAGAVAKENATRAHLDDEFAAELDRLGKVSRDLEAVEGDSQQLLADVRSSNKQSRLILH